MFSCITKSPQSDSCSCVYVVADTKEVSEKASIVLNDQLGGSNLKSLCRFNLSRKKGEFVVFIYPYNPRGFFAYLLPTLKKASGFKTIVLIVSHSSWTKDDLMEEAENTTSLTSKIRKKLVIISIFRTINKEQLVYLKSIQCNNK